MKRWRASEHLAKGILALFAGVVVATAAMAWRNTERLQVNDAAVTHSWQVLSAIERLLSTLKDVETGQRGYLLTEAPTFLAPYDQATKQVHQRQDDLLVLVAAEPDQVERMKGMQPLVAQQIEETDLVLDVHRNSGSQAARARLLEGRGKQRMDAIRGLAADVFRIVNEETRRPVRQPGGLGIGLALVKRLIELHGGTVVALSEGLDKGSEFVVTLNCSR